MRSASVRREHEAYRPGYEITAERILEFISAEALHPGDRLPTEQELADRLGVSRTTIRESVKILSTLGRLTVRKGSGIFVADVASRLDGQDPWNFFLPGALDQVEMLFDFRRIIETNTSRYAADHATPAQVRAIRLAADATVAAAQDSDFDSFRRHDETFHLAVATGSHNMFLCSAVDRVIQLKRQVLTIGLLAKASGPMLVGAEKHRRIAQAIADGETELAAAAMAEHIETAERQFREAIALRLTPELGRAHDQQEQSSHPPPAPAPDARRRRVVHQTATGQ